MAVIVLDTHFVSPRCFQRTELFRGSSYLMFKFRTQAEEALGTHHANLRCPQHRGEPYALSEAVLTWPPLPWVASACIRLTSSNTPLITGAGISDNFLKETPIHLLSRRPPLCSDFHTHVIKRLCLPPSLRSSSHAPS